MYFEKSSTAGLAATFTVLTLLAGCSSGGSSDDATVAPAENTTDSAANTNTPADDASAPMNTTGSPEAELVGTWRLCADVTNLMIEYVFTTTTYTNTVGTGTCAGFDTQSLVAGGSYTINGTLLSDSGLESYSLALNQQSLNGETLSEAFRQTLYQLVYTGVENQLSFSDYEFEESEISLTLNLQAPYIRIR